ncbi:DUF6412 domain-containing protein [Amycolatopsis sp. GM8]|uniref:DUF6412 domain-containing protein n=1 Tax=Amycolatopsis sp. GM8 TaxID=2896530 RepID=UPI001F1E88C1|nr:DUF6412 domain-containing protein [Amycolatopsis sp. GM8]
MVDTDLGARLKFALAVVLPALFLALPAVGASPAELATALAAGVAALAVIGICLRVEITAAPTHVRAVSLRDRVLGRVRLCDPDAPGRARPRAPAAAVPAA